MFPTLHLKKPEIADISLILMYSISQGCCRGVTNTGNLDIHSMVTPNHIHIWASFIAGNSRSTGNDENDIAYECPECGTEVSANAMECPNCGIEFDDSPRDRSHVEDNRENPSSPSPSETEDRLWNAYFTVAVSMMIGYIFLSLMILYFGKIGFFSLISNILEAYGLKIILLPLIICSISTILYWWEVKAITESVFVGFIPFLEIVLFYIVFLLYPYLYMWVWIVILPILMAFLIFLAIYIAKRDKNNDTQVESVSIRDHRGPRILEESSSSTTEESNNRTNVESKTHRGPRILIEESQNTESRTRKMEIVCNICMGHLKRGAPVFECPRCQLTYHDNCGLRIGTCPECGMKWTEEIIRTHTKVIDLEPVYDQQAVVEDELVYISDGERKSMVRGYVNDAIMGSYIEGARISLTSIDEDREYATETDKDGNYKLGGINNGKYILSVDVEDYKGEKEELKIDEPGVIIKNLSLLPHSKQGTIKIKVKDIKNSVSEAVVTLFKNNSEVVSTNPDDNGELRFILDEGKYRVEVTRDDEKRSKEVRIKGDSTMSIRFFFGDITIPIPEQQTVNFKIIDTSNIPVSDAKIALGKREGEDIEKVTASTNDRGMATIDVESSGRYYLGVQKKGYWNVYHKLEVNDLFDLEVKVIISEIEKKYKRTWPLFRDEEGKTRPFREVIAKDRSGNVWGEGTINEEGIVNMEFEDVPAADRENISIEITNMNVAKDTADIMLRVTDSSGWPLEDVKISLKGGDNNEINVASTDDSGQADFEIKNTGNYVLSLTKEGYLGIKEILSLKELVDMDLDINLTSLTKSYRLKVGPFKNKEGNFMTGKEVRILDENKEGLGSAATNNEGIARIDLGSYPRDPDNLMLEVEGTNIKKRIRFEKGK